MSYNKPLPDPNKALTRPFWLGLREHRLMVQHCRQCRALRYPPAPLCPECLALGGDWVEIARRGVLWSYVVYHRSLAAPFAADVPYAIGVVEVEGGLHILAGIEGPIGQYRIGAPMQALFDQVTAEVTLLRWSPAAEATAP